MKRFSVPFYFLFLLLLGIVISSCSDESTLTSNPMETVQDIAEKTNEGVEELELNDTTKYLKHRDPETGSTYASLFINMIPSRAIIQYEFEMKEDYPPDFQLTSNSSSEILGGAVISGFIYESESLGEMRITITRYQTQEVATAGWLGRLDDCANLMMQHAAANGVDVGDIAYGDRSSVVFLRANLVVTINCNDVLEIADIIDQQILEAAAKAAEREE